MVDTRPMIMFERFLVDTGIFWQYPARTEEAMYKKQSRENSYMPIPWATIIDKHTDIVRITNSITQVVMRCHPRPNQTCCQHVHWRKLLHTFKSLGISKLYTPHKLRGEDWIDGIQIVACPLFAVNIEDPKFSVGRHSDNGARRLYLYSFIGAYAPHYISRIRPLLFEMKHPKDAVVRNIGIWHLEKVVYSQNQNAHGHITEDREREARTLEYNAVLCSSNFSLCPSGAGPSSIRLWESLATGAIPVILSDGMCLPDESNPIWNKSVVRIDEKDIHTLEKTLRKYSDEDILEMRHACKEAYAKYALRFEYIR